jgi:hypothetical protein
MYVLCMYYMIDLNVYISYTFSKIYVSVVTHTHPPPMLRYSCPLVPTFSFYPHVYVCMHDVCRYVYQNVSVCIISWYITPILRYGCPLVPVFTFLPSTPIPHPLTLTPYPLTLTLTSWPLTPILRYGCPLVPMFTLYPHLYEYDVCRYISKLIHAHTYTYQYIIHDTS